MDITSFAGNLKVKINFKKTLPLLYEAEDVFEIWFCRLPCTHRRIHSINLMSATWLNLNVQERNVQSIEGAQRSRTFVSSSILCLCAHFYFHTNGITIELCWALFVYFYTYFYWPKTHAHTTHMLIGRVSAWFLHLCCVPQNLKLRIKFKKNKFIAKVKTKYEINYLANRTPQIQAMVKCCLNAFCIQHNIFFSVHFVFRFGAHYDWHSCF